MVRAIDAKSPASAMVRDVAQDWHEVGDETRRQHRQRLGRAEPRAACTRHGLDVRVHPPFAAVRLGKMEQVVGDDGAH
jgi:hypothetical protein